MQLADVYNVVECKESQVQIPPFRLKNHILDSPSNLLLTALLTREVSNDRFQPVSLQTQGTNIRALTEPLWQSWKLIEDSKRRWNFFSEEGLG